MSKYDIKNLMFFFNVQLIKKFIYFYETDQI